jgi:hypothetical protein
MSFIVKLAIYSLLIFGIMTGISVAGLPDKLIYPKWHMIWVFMVIITILFHYLLARAAEKSPAAFVRAFMGATAGKLFLFMIILVGYGLLNQETAIPFILNFFILYLAFTVFEVGVLYRQHSSR